MEQRITMKQAGRLFDPVKSHRSVNWYANTGILVNNERVTLQFEWNGGEKVTTEEWVREFQEQVNKKNRPTM